ncbi:MAG: hypothetical protein JOZ81_08135 [Chloroflexi bacterium]|nr:hypothetical protein [Chloroflexota bacterium]
MRWALVFGLALAWQTAAAFAATAWEQWQHVPGVVDVGGVRSDGKLVLMANGQMLLAGVDGVLTPFARGTDGFSGSPDAEPYFVVASSTPGQCQWEPDDAFVLDLSSPPGLIRVDPAGHASRFATFASMDTLNGIAFDTVGSFGYRVLVTGSAHNQEAVFGVDCQGAVTTLSNDVPTMEGGFAVAPQSFGSFAGDLIGADENTGQIWAIAPDGTSSLVLVSGLPSGGDTGVESIGIVPPGFGAAYLADRATANNPFPGTDSLLRLTASTLSAAGVQPGDLLVATEGGGTTLDVRCTSASSGCTATTVADGPAGGQTGHIEGHITVVPGP